MDIYDFFSGSILFGIVFAVILEEIMLIVITVKLADLKGRDAFVWGILTFFFSLLPVFISALSPDSYYSAPSRYTENLQQTERICSDSNRGVSKNSRYAPTITRSRKTSSGWVCGNCGVENADQDRACSACFNPKRF